MTSISISSNSYSLEAPAPTSPRSANWKGKTLAVGSRQISQYLQQLFFQLGLPIQVKSEKIRWSRDCRVNLPNGSHLIPYPLNMDRLLHEFHSLLPMEMIHFIDNNESPFGQGFCNGYRARAFQVARRNKIPFFKARTCIEGGNCRIFIASDGKPKAIIGYNSLILSVISLRRQKYFERIAKEVENLLKVSGEPSLDSLRIARNIHLFSQNQRRLARQLLPEETAHKYANLASQIEVLFKLTKAKMAEELGIPLDRIAFVYQENFHIDMELFAGPGDVVFLHDEEQMLKLQKSLDEEKVPFLLKTIAHSEARVERMNILLKKNLTILEEIGCKPVPIPGLLQGSSQPGATINFMNGFLLDGEAPQFITNGPGHNPTASFLKEAFLKKVYEACPSLRVSFVTGHLPTLLAKENGGLNCLSSIVD